MKLTTANPCFICLRVAAGCTRPEGAAWVRAMLPAVAGRSPPAAAVYCMLPCANQVHTCNPAVLCCNLHGMPDEDGVASMTLTTSPGALPPPCRPGGQVPQGTVTAVLTLLQQLMQPAADAEGADGSATDASPGAGGAAPDLLRWRALVTGELRLRLLLQHASMKTLC